MFMLVSSKSQKFLWVSFGILGKRESGSKSFYEKHNFIAKFSKSHTQTNLGSHQNSTIKFFLAKIVDVSDQSY